MPLSFVAMPRGAFTGVHLIFLLSLPICAGSGIYAECVSLPHEWNRRPHTAGQTGKNDCCHPAGQVQSDRKHSYFLVDGLPFSRFRRLPFLLVVSSFYGFSLKFLYSNLPLFSFTSILRLSVESHQAVIFVLGAKVIPGFDGKARSSLLFSAKISSPSGSISAEKPCIP